MLSITLPQMKTAIEHCVIRMDQPWMFWGPSGVGKTEVAGQAAAAADAILVDVRASMWEGVDFRGIPDVQSGRTVWNIPATLPFVGNDLFPDDRLIVIMLDEINAGQDDVLAVCYQLIQEYRVGEHVLKPNVRIMAAGNRDSDRGVTRRMPAPLCNRLTHAEIVPDAMALANYLLSKGFPRSIVGFLLFRKHLVHTFDSKQPMAAWASSRSWERAFKYYTDAALPADLKHAAICGSVGVGPAGEFEGYLALLGRLVTTRQIIADPDGAPLPDDEGMAWATAMNISGDMTLANVKPLSRYLDRMAGTSRLGPEYAIVAWQLALERKGNEALTDADEFIAFAKQYRGVFG